MMDVEDIIKYTFKNKDLLKEAFTHASYTTDTGCLSYERLEFLGDSVLNMLISRLHYHLYPTMAPGMLTQLRAANVDTEALARAALKWHLHDYIRKQPPLLHNTQIQEFIQAVAEYPSHTRGMIDAPKVLADILESLIGAVFIDSGLSLDATWKVVERLLQPLITPENLPKQPVARFKEACQNRRLKPHTVDMWKETGKIEIYLKNELIGSGICKTKKAVAVNRASYDAYNNLPDGNVCIEIEYYVYLRKVMFFIFFVFVGFQLLKVFL